MSDGDPTADTGVSFAEPFVDDAEVERVTSALSSGWLTTGPKTEAFESGIAEFTGADHAIGTVNCTSALYLSLRALDVTGEVVTSPMTFATTVSSCQIAGATPVLADVRPDTLTLEPESVKEALSPATEAIIPVHYAGQAADMDALRDIARDHDLALIEDAAHGLGGFYEGTPLGTIGDAGCLSFYATKTITTGEGGMLLTGDEGVADRAGNLRIAGVDKDAWSREGEEDAGWSYDVTAASLKFNMNDIQASVGLAQLEKLDDILKRRRRLAERYDEELGDTVGVEPLGVRDPTEHARHLYPVFVDETEPGLDRNEVAERLSDRGIETSVHYIPIHYHSAFGDVDRVSLDATERAFESVLCLPLHPRMDEDDVETVVDALWRL